MASRITQDEREKIILDHLTGMTVIKLAEKYCRTRMAINNVLNASKERIDEAKANQLEAYRQKVELLLDDNTVWAVEQLSKVRECYGLLLDKFMAELKSESSTIVGPRLMEAMRTAAGFFKDHNELILKMQKGQAE